MMEGSVARPPRFNFLQRDRTKIGKTQKMLRRKPVLSKLLKRMAGTTRLELATSAVTGQRSNQLNYVPTLQQAKRK